MEGNIKQATDIFIRYYGCFWPVENEFSVFHEDNPGYLRDNIVKVMGH